MPIVDIKGVGKAQFPDGMSVDDIRSFLKSKYAQQLNQSDLLQPVENTASAYTPSLAQRAGQGIADVLTDTGIISDRYGAQRIGSNLTSLGEFLPVIGDAAAGDEFGKAAAEGDYSGMALAGLGVIPVVGDVAKKAIKGLPMDEVSRMARASEQGFDVDQDWYHGTGNLSGLAEEGFASRFLGSGADQWGTGYYLTNKPSTASGYAEGANAGIVPAKIKMENPLYIDSTQARSLDDAMELTPEQVRSMLDDNPALKRGVDDDEMNPLGDHYDSFWEGGAEDWMLDDLAEKYTNPNHLSNDLFDGDEESFLKALEKVTGHDGVIVNFPETGEQFAIPFKNTQIRSKFAKFDPKNKSKSGLLGGLGALGLGVGLNQNNKEDEKYQ